MKLYTVLVSGYYHMAMNDISQIKLESLVYVSVAEVDICRSETEKKRHLKEPYYNIYNINKVIKHANVPN